MLISPAFLIAAILLSSKSKDKKLYPIILIGVMAIILKTYSQFCQSYITNTKLFPILSIVRAEIRGIAALLIYSKNIKHINLKQKDRMSGLFLFERLQ